MKDGEVKDGEMNMPHYKEVALNFNRSGTKYNPPADWKPGMPLATLITKDIGHILTKFKRRKSRAARRYDDHFTLPKRLHTKKLRGAGDHLTNQQRFEKNRRER